MFKKVTIRLSDDEFSQVAELAKNSRLPIATFAKTRFIAGLDSAHVAENFEAQIVIQREVMRRLALMAGAVFSMLPPAEKTPDALAANREKAQASVDAFFGTTHESED
jgi:hypothetical protein